MQEITEDGPANQLGGKKKENVKVNSASGK